MADSAYKLSRTDNENLWKFLNEDSNKEAGTVLSVDKTGMKVSCGNGILLVKKVQFPNGKPLTIEQYINGNSIEEGIKLI